MKTSNKSPKNVRQSKANTQLDYPKMNLKSLRKVSKVKGGFDQSLMQLGLTIEAKSLN
jgi:hypothetical protein